jgi:hypothetical protein
VKRGNKTVQDMASELGVPYFKVYNRMCDGCITAPFHHCGVSRRRYWTSAEYAEIRKGFKKRG